MQVCFGPGAASLQANGDMLTATLESLNKELSGLGSMIQME